LSPFPKPRARKLEPWALERVIFSLAWPFLGKGISGHVFSLIERLLYSNIQVKKKFYGTKYIYNGVMWTKSMNQISAIYSKIITKKRHIYKSIM
jgi:hypothetical protein